MHTAYGIYWIEPREWQRVRRLVLEFFISVFTLSQTRTAHNAKWLMKMFKKGNANYEVVRALVRMFRYAYIGTNLYLSEHTYFKIRCCLTNFPLFFLFIVWKKGIVFPRKYFPNFLSIENRLSIPCEIETPVGGESFPTSLWSGSTGIWQNVTLAPPSMGPVNRRETSDRTQPKKKTDLRERERMKNNNVQ